MPHSCLAPRERRHVMLYPLILWLLGVPLVLIILLMLLGII
jgi:hypothetical protein